jgi:CheY-like chemotaxis protein
MSSARFAFQPHDRILVIEDEFLIALDLQRILEELGAGEVVLANTQARAEAALAQNGAFDLAIADLRIGDHDIQPFVADLAKRGIPLLLATGSEPTVPKGRAAVIRKPYSDSQIVEALQAILGR